MASILLIDDDDQFRMMLSEILRRAGYEVVEASDGKQGSKIYCDNPTDLIITDLIMPNKEGIELITELRRSNPEAKIIAMSGGGRVNAKNYLSMAERFGAQRVLAKPFPRVDLLATVEELLARP